MHTMSRICILVVLLLASFTCLAQAAPSWIITATPVWDDPYVGDPLYLRVVLACPQAEAAHANPKAPSNWVDGVRLTLSRSEKDTPVETLAADVWQSYRLTPDLAAQSYEPITGIYTADWAMPGDVAKLTSGEYTLAVTWQGPDGTVDGDPISLEVQPIEHDYAKGVQLSRAAIVASRLGDHQQAYADGLQALELAGLAPQEQITLQLTIAGAAVGLQKYEEALAIYEEIQREISAFHCHPLASRVSRYISVLRTALGLEEEVVSGEEEPESVEKGEETEDEPDTIEIETDEEFGDDIGE